MIFFVELRSRLKEFYAGYDIFIRPLIKFLFAFAVLFFIQHYIGYMDAISKLPVIFACAVVCMALPWGAPAFFGGLFTLLDMSEVSIIFAGMSFIFFLLIAVLYFGFRPGNGFLMAFVPLMFMLKLPFAVPLILGLCAGASSAVPAACGVFSYFVIKYFHDNAATMGSGIDLDNLTGNIMGIFDGITGNKYMLLIIVAFAAVIIVVSIVRSLSVDHSWTIAVAAGVLLELTVIVGGAFFIGETSAIFSDLAGIIVSAVIAFIYEHTFFAVDYRGTERVQFEDDDYYYYVKAVPKLYGREEDERRE